MKKLLVLLLSVFLLLPAYAEETDVVSWAVRNTVFDFSIMYPSYIIDCHTIPEEEAGENIEEFEPISINPNARLWCRVSDDPDYPDWANEGYSEVAVDEPSLELEVPMETHYGLYRNRERFVEEIRLSEPAGQFDYVFDIFFPEEDSYSRKIFEDMLKTLEFPPQAGQAGAFLLDFYREEYAHGTYTEIIVDEDASIPIVLLPLETVTNFTLESVEWDEETFTPKAFSTLYHADELPVGEKLHIFTYIPDVLSNLRFRYTSKGGDDECLYIFQSGRDGSLLLLEDMGM